MTMGLICLTVGSIAGNRMVLFYHSPLLYGHCSFECSQHEAKARERKEELEGQAKEMQNSLAEFEGTSGGREGEGVDGERERGERERVKEMRCDVKVTTML